MKKTFGFTLIEMLVVIGIVGIVLPSVFAIIFAVIRQQARVYALKQIKREGDFVLNKMEDQIRNNAVGIYTAQTLDQEVCDQAKKGDNPYPLSGTDNGVNFYFKDKSDNWFQYYLNGSKVTYKAPSVSSDLTTSAVQISTFSLSCNRAAAYSPPIITISFDISYGGANFQEQIARLHYQTQIAMKSY